MIALRCLEKEPARRYPSAGAVAAELRRFRDGEPIEARPPTRGERLARWARRHRALAAGVAVSVVTLVGLLVAGAAGAVVAVQRIRAERDEATRQRRAAEESEARASRQLAAALREKGERLASEARHEEAWTLLARSLELQDSLATRLALGQARALAPRRLGAVQSEQGGRESALLFDPLGVRLASAGVGGALEVREAAGLHLDSTHPLPFEGSVEPDREGWPPARVTAWGAERLLAVAEPGTLRVFEVDLASGSAPTLLAATALPPQATLNAIAMDEWSGQVAVALEGGAAAGQPRWRVERWRLERGDGASARLVAAPCPPLSPKDEYTNGVRGLTFGWSGALLASASLDRGVRLYDLERSGAACVVGHSNGVNSVAFTDDGLWLVTGAGDGAVKLWRVQRGISNSFVREIRTLTDAAGGVGPVAVTQASDDGFGAHGWLLAAGSMDRTVRVWRVTTTRRPASLRSVEAVACLGGFGSGVSELALTSDGRALAARSYDGQLMAWDLAALHAQPALRSHSADVVSVAFSGDGALLASAAWDAQQDAPQEAEIVLWDVRSARRWGGLPGHPGGVIRLAFRPGDPVLLASAGEDGAVRLWDVREGRLAATPLEPGGPRVRALGFTADGALLAWGDAQGAVVLWDAEARAVVRTFPGGGRAAECLAFDVGPAPRLALGDWGSAIRVLALDGAEPGATLTGHRYALQALTFAPGGRLLSGARQHDSDVLEWGLARGEVARRFVGHRGAVRGLAVHPRLSVFASAGADGTVKLWDLQAPGPEVAPLGTLSGHVGGVRAVAFAPDGRLLASGSRDGTVRLWRVGALGEDRRRLIEGAAETTYRVVEVGVVPR